MANLEKKARTANALVSWSTVSADFAEDLSRGVLGFIPNGIHLVYDSVFKPLPLLGRVFSHRWVEQLFKFCLGVTIGQGLATDFAYYIFRPMGWCLGAFLGILFSSKVKPPKSQGQISKLLYRFSGQTVGGALLAITLAVVACQIFDIAWLLTPQVIAIIAAIGAILGLAAKTLLLLATNTVHSANAATVRRTVQRAKELNAKLLTAAKLKAKSRILIHAQDIIQQINGPQSQHNLEAFLTSEYDNIAINTNKKIERHIHYLTDRACHGDVKAFSRLQELIPTRNPTAEGGKNPLEIMLDRIFNLRAIFKLKDDVDTAYDRWQYRFLSKKH